MEQTVICDISRWKQSCSLGGQENYIIASYDVPTGTCRIRSIQATWWWVDQGWGYKKGSIRIHRVKPDGTSQSMSMTPEACAHSMTEMGFVWPDVVLKGTNPKFYDKASTVLTAVQEGDRLDIEACIGGGGGHELLVEKLKIAVEFSRPWKHRSGMIMWRLAKDVEEFPRGYPAPTSAPAATATASSADGGSTA